MPGIHGGNRSYFEAARWQPCLLVRQPLQTRKKGALQRRWMCGGWSDPNCANRDTFQTLTSFWGETKTNRKSLWNSKHHNLRPQTSTNQDCFWIFLDHKPVAMSGYVRIVSAQGGSIPEDFWLFRVQDASSIIASDHLSPIPQVYRGGHLTGFPRAVHGLVILGGGWGIPWGRGFLFAFIVEEWKGGDKLLMSHWRSLKSEIRGLFLSVAWRSFVHGALRLDPSRNSGGCDLMVCNRCRYLMDLRVFSPSWSSILQVWRRNIPSG